MRRIIISLKNVLIILIAWFMSFFIRRDKKKIALGSWNGKMYSDNPKYFLEYALKVLDQSYQFYWVGEKCLLPAMPKDNRITIIKKDSFKAMLTLMKCKYFISSQLMTTDICSHNIYRGAVLIMPYHGFPIKKIGDDIIGHANNKIKEKIRRILAPFQFKYNYFFASSAVHGQNLLTAFKHVGCQPDIILKIGTPRNDFLINLQKEKKEELTRRYKEMFGIPYNKKIILYMPTFRRKGTKNESLYLRKNTKERILINEILENNGYVLMEKMHFADSDSLNDDGLNEISNYVHVTKNVDPQELLAVADVLVTDYSSCFVDYLLLDRPIIHYIYDYETYKDIDSGLYFTKEEFACGEIAQNYEELLNCLESILAGNDCCQKLRAEKRKEFLEYEKGNASKYIIDSIILQGA